jgi:hypothetical protein
VRTISTTLAGAMRTRAGGALSVLAGITIMVAGLVPASLTVAASAADPGVEDVGLFELEGNIAQDATTPPPYDWQCVFNTPAHTGCPPSAPAAADKVFQSDATTPDPTYFSSNGAGVKDIDLISQWGCTTLNNPLNKDDILNAYGAAFILPQGWHVPAGDPVQPGDVIVTLAQERDSNNGDSFAGFWLMKGQHTCTNGTFNGQHDAGDLLVVSNYTNGGGTATVELWQWTNDPSVSNHLVQLGSGFTCGETPPAGVTSAGLMCAIANGGPVTEPWSPNQTLASNQFVEVGLDLSALIPPISDSTACFGQFMAETRSSQELTATLKDYTGGQFKLCVNPTVTTQQTAGGHTAASQVVAPGTAVTDQASLSGAISGTPGGTIQYKLTKGTACNGTLVYDSGALPLSGGVVPASGAAHPTDLGQYEWQAFYSGDVPSGRNRGGTSACGDEPLTVVDANISIVQSAINEVGHDHVFTVTVNALGATGLTVAYDSIAPAAVDSGSSAPSTSSTTCGAPVISNGGDTATCTLTIGNTVQDEFVANASASLHIGGLAVSRTTAAGGNAGPGGSGPATKDYVDGSIALSPLNAENAVGAPHTFTVTANAYHPAGVAATFLSITPTITEAAGTPPPSSNSTTCASPVTSNGGDTATCTVTIDSSSSGTYFLNATTQIRFSRQGDTNLTIERSTDASVAPSGPNGTGKATKVYDAPHIVITPSGVNEVGHQHVFTVTVTAIPNATTVFNSIDVSVLDSGSNPPGTMSTTCGSPVITSPGGVATATCTVSIDNATADVFTASATAHMTINGFATSVTTDGLGLDSGPATKAYVDASVSIDPATAENEVGHQHVFTVTVTALPASSATYSFDSITPSVLDSLSHAPGSMSTTCATPQVSGNVATCTVTIDNSSADTFTANAAVQVTVDGLALSRTTAPDGGQAGPDGSGPATKVYVDASVGIGPSAVNPIGKEHVFTVVVNAYSQGETPVVFESITPSVAPQPLSMTTTCDNPTVSATPTGEQATCTLTIDNDLPSTFTANVVAEVQMGTVTVTRSTASNPGPGGTGPATKTYVSANIGISPLTADDPVGDLHTLTATVTTNDGSGEGQPQAAPDGTVVNLSIVSGPGSLASPTCTVSNGNGTCTDVLTSSVAGTTVVRASVKLTVDGVQLTRSTGDSVPGDSVDAVKNWHKVQPAIATVQSAGGTIGTPVSDTATVSGGLTPSGTVAFQLFGPDDTTCSATPVFVSSDQPLASGSAQSGSFTPTTPGTYQWVATYNGDDANLSAVSGCGDEPVSILAAAVLGITTPNTGAELGGALAEGVGLMLAGTGIVVLARRRRRAA